MTQNEFNKIIHKHNLFLVDNPDGEKANFQYEDLRNLDMSNLDMTGINFEGANLSLSNIENSILRFCNFKHCIFHETNLTGAYLYKTIFDDAVFKKCKFPDSFPDEEAVFRYRCRNK